MTNPSKHEGKADDDVDGLHLEEPAGSPTSIDLSLEEKGFPFAFDFRSEQNVS